MRADPGLIGLDDEIERGWLHVALFGQDRFQRPPPQLHLGQVRAVRVMILVMVMIAVMVSALLTEKVATTAVKDASAAVRKLYAVNVAFGLLTCAG